MLKILAVNEPISTWELAKVKLMEQSKSKKPPSYREIQTETSVIFRRIKELEKKGFMEKKGERSSKGSVVPTYGLTFKGLIAILAEDANIWDKIDDVVHKQHDVLPEYFELWDSFGKLDVKDIALKNMKYAVNVMKNGKPFFPYVIDGRYPTSRDFFLAYAVCLPTDASMSDEQRWIGAALSEKRLYDLIIHVLKWFYEAHKRSAGIWKKQYDEWSKVGE